MSVNSVWDNLWPTGAAWLPWLGAGVVAIIAIVFWRVKALKRVKVFGVEAERFPEGHDPAKASSQAVHGNTSVTVTDNQVQGSIGSISGVVMNPAQQKRDEPPRTRNG